MAKVVVTETYLEDIADAIREQNGEETTYKPSEMAQAVLDLEVYPEPTGTKSITANGTGIDVKDYASADVNVPNSYSQADEGKVVSEGALVAQSSDTVTENDTYDTTLISSLTVNVPSGGGEYIFSVNNPTAADGSDGDTFIKYTLIGGASVEAKVKGGYNGGAVITVTINGTQAFTATASDTYNRNYNNTHADVTVGSDTVSIDVTPPDSNTGKLYITLESSTDSHTSEFSAAGSNTSYGYGTNGITDTYHLGLAGGATSRQASAIYIKENSAWKGVGDIV